MIRLLCECVIERRLAIVIPTPDEAHGLIWRGRFWRGLEMGLIVNVHKDCPEESTRNFTNRQSHKVYPGDFIEDG